MAAALFIAVWLVTAFLAGSIPCGWLAARAKHIDIRSVGSGNIGGTNVWRALGWKWGLSVLLADMLKGLLPLLLLTLCLNAGGGAAIGQGWQAPLKMLAALAAVMGHTFTPWLGFRGGKGAATGLGVILVLYQVWVLIPLAVLGVTLAATRYVSLGNMLAATSVAVISVAVPQLRVYWPFGVLAAALVVYMHRSNIRRLLAGTEPKVGQRKA